MYWLLLFKEQIIIIQKNKLLFKLVQIIHIKHLFTLDLPFDAIPPLMRASRKAYGSNSFFQSYIKILYIQKEQNAFLKRL